MWVSEFVVGKNNLCCQKNCRYNLKRVKSHVLNVMGYVVHRVVYIPKMFATYNYFHDNVPLS